MDTEQTKTEETTDTKTDADVVPTLESSPSARDVGTRPALDVLDEPVPTTPPSALETYRTATATRLAAEKAWHGSHANQGEQFAAEVAYLEAAQAEAAAERAAALELEQQEIAEGDALTSAASLPELCSDVETLTQRQADLTKELQETIAAIPARVQLAKDAMPRLSTRRASAGLPAPLPCVFAQDLPTLKVNLAKRADVAADGTTTRLAAARERLAAWRGARAEVERKEAAANAERAKTEATTAAEIDAKEAAFTSRLEAHAESKGAA